MGTHYGKEYLSSIYGTKTISVIPDIPPMKKEDYHADPISILYIHSNLRLVTDLQTCVKAQQNRAYAHKVKLTNLKQMAETIVYVQEHGYNTRDHLQSQYQEIFSKKQSTKNVLNAVSKEKINKGLTIEQLEQTLKYMEKYDVISKGYFSFIIGFPWDTLETCMDTIEYAASILQRYGPGLVNLNWLYLFPSQIWTEREKYGINLSENIFDDFYYMTDPYVAKEIRPNLKEYEMKYIQDKLTYYADLGYSLQNG